MYLIGATLAVHGAINYAERLDLRNFIFGIEIIIAETINQFFAKVKALRATLRIAIHCVSLADFVLISSAREIRVEYFISSHFFLSFHGMLEGGGGVMRFRRYRIPFFL